MICRLVILNAHALLVSTLAWAAEGNPRTVINERHRTLLQEHCAKCHNAKKSSGKFRVDNLPFAITTIESTERWRKVLNTLNSNAMPPEDEKPLDSKAKADFLDDISQALVAAHRGLANQENVGAMRRLNRREYKNTLRELLGVEIDVSELPADTGTGGFDTMAANLFMSSDQFEQYLALGREAVDEAFERHFHATAARKERFEAEVVVDRVRSSLQKRIELHRRYVLWSKAVDQAAEQPENRAVAAQIRAALKSNPPWDFYHSWKKLKNVPSPMEYGFVDAERATHEGVSAWNLLPYQAYFLVQPELKTGAFLTIRDNGVNPIFNFAIGYDWPPGDYVVRIRIAATPESTPERRFVEFGVQSTLLSTHEVLGTMEAPQAIEVPFNLTKTRDRSFFLREKGTFDTNEQGHRVFAEGERRNGIGPEFALWVDWAEVEKIPTQPKQMAPGLNSLRIPLGDDVASFSPADLRSALERFTVEACRGNTPSPSFLDRLVAIYNQRRKAGVLHGSALKDTLAVILASPRFLYLTEPTNAKEHRQLSANELAIRLSYFLWGAPPDAISRNLASRGDLMKPEMLAKETNRLIDDPRSEGFAIPFVHQWLGMDRLDFFRFNNARYPAFDESTKMAARSEVYQTFAYLLRDNASLRHLLKSDFVVVNSLLANYYGLKSVNGDSFRKVMLPKESPRGGLLGMAAILAMGSNGEQTSPVERGAWVLRKLLNDPPPPAPPNVPQISRLQGRRLTTIERLRAHQEQPQCTSCHRKIDPIGLGLENFNTVGQWRTEESDEAAGLPKKSWTIDPAHSFHNGPGFKNFFELRDIIASKSDAFARGFSIAILEYALGRPHGDSDEPLIAEMINQARKRDFATREFIQVLVRSKEFHSK